VAEPSELALLDWKRRIFELYAEVRRAQDPALAWRRWRDARDELFRSHPQSPLPRDARATFRGLPYFDYDPAFRVLGEVVEQEPQQLLIAASGDETVAFNRFGRVEFRLGAGAQTLDVYWLEGYGGGVFLPFADATSGAETYGAGRYLLDTVKGSDLGSAGGRLVLDFNFSYNPSCAYDWRWVCPLAPPANRLSSSIRAGERAG
jgi:uncharacterized protein (DUF1684 family)